MSYSSRLTFFVQEQSLIITVIHDGFKGSGSSTAGRLKGTVVVYLETQ